MRPLIAAIALMITPLLPAAAPADEAADLEQLYAPYQKILDAHLIEKKLDGGGLVAAFDYDAAMADPVIAQRLAAQKSTLANFDPEQLEARSTAIAFWINAYNFFMLQHILENPHDGAPVDSVKDYGSLFNPYQVFSREIFTVGGRNYSLDTIEKDRLLGEEYAARGWKDARVHLAVNCASVGCAYTPPPTSRPCSTRTPAARWPRPTTCGAMATPCGSASSSTGTQPIISPRRTRSAPGCCASPTTPRPRRSAAPAPPNSSTTIGI